MRQTVTSIALASVLSVAAGVALSQPMMGPGGLMHRQGPGMVGQGWGYSDPAGYLNDLKLALAISATQQPAWNEYADAVKGMAAQMQGLHQSMYESMGTATWQERRDMMNRMFEARQQSYDVVHAAAEKLVAVLDPPQRTKAATSLPGLTGPGYGMMGRVAPGQRAP